MSDNIHIKLPDGSNKEFFKGTIALDGVKSISFAAAGCGDCGEGKVAKSEWIRRERHRPSGSGGRSYNEGEESDKSVRPTQAQAGEGARPTQSAIAGRAVMLKVFALAILLSGQAFAQARAPAYLRSEQLDEITAKNMQSAGRLPFRNTVRP